MKKTGSEMPSADGAPAGNEGPAETIERAQLQADVARQRVRLAKEELRRARKRLKEAKREAKRARRHAALARKDWKRARRQAKKKDAAEAAMTATREPAKAGRLSGGSGSTARQRAGNGTARATTRGKKKPPKTGSAGRTRAERGTGSNRASR